MYIFQLGCTSEQIHNVEEGFFMNYGGLLQLMLQKDFYELWRPSSADKWNKKKKATKLFCLLIAHSSQFKQSWNSNEALYYHKCITSIQTYMHMGLCNYTGMGNNFYQKWEEISIGIWQSIIPSIPQAVTEHMYYDLSAYPLPRACILFVRNSAGICMQCMHLIYMEVRVMQLQ